LFFNKGINVIYPETLIAYPLKIGFSKSALSSHTRKLCVSYYYCVNYFKKLEA